MIGEEEVGIVYKKYSLNLFRRKSSTGQLISRGGEAGWQARTLGPGPHYGYWKWLYEIRRVPLTIVPAGQIGLVVAKDGEPLAPGQLLGGSVECTDFQNGERFLKQGGQRGKQLNILATGFYRINTELFDIITADIAQEKDLEPQDLAVYTVEEGKIGVVTTQGGSSLPAGEIAGPTVYGHENFQDLQKFIDSGGCRGLQEEYLASGSYRLNPWFIKVRQIPLTNIPAGTVGVVISHVGDFSGSDTHDGLSLVDKGCKGIWKTPLYPGRHPINSEVMDLVIVPTNPIALDWSKERRSDDDYDSNLRPLQLRSKDGFLFDIEVTQVIRVDTRDAPRMIASIGVQKTDEANLSIHTAKDAKEQKYSSIKSLVTKVLEPTIGNYFRNSAQGYNALDFHDARIDRQLDAKDYIDGALRGHGVRSVDTLINQIGLPSELEELRQARACNRGRTQHPSRTINYRGRPTTT